MNVSIVSNEIASPVQVPVAPTTAKKKLHRIATARHEQGVSLRTAARQMGRRVSEVKAEENETRDLRLTDLARWQRVLRVPLQDLLVEPDTSLSKPVMQRAQMLRLMKTVASLNEVVQNQRAKRLATQLVDQLVQMMPELESVPAWNSVGQRRTPSEYGRVVEKVISHDLLRR